MLCVGIVLTVAVGGCTPPVVNDEPGKALQGVWRVVQRSASDGGGSTGSDAVQPGLYMFAFGHYSIMQVIGSEPRPPLPRPLEKASSAELVAVLGETFQANAGAYAVIGNTLLLRPIVAKNPGAMAAGHEVTATWSVTGGRLTITSPPFVTILESATTVANSAITK